MSLLSRIFQKKRSSSNRTTYLLEMEAAASVIVKKNAATAAKLLLEVSNCWREAMFEALNAPDDERDQRAAILFRDKMEERAMVPIEKMFTRMNASWEEYIKDR